MTVIVLLVLPAAIAKAESVLLTGATVHTVSGETLSPGAVLIREGKIVSVSRNVAARADKVVDLKGLHLYPGLILPTSTLGLWEVSSVRATRDYQEVGQYTPDVESWIAVNPDSELLPVARANGITHFLPVPSGGIVSGTSGLMQMSGWTIEEMAIKRPAALHLFWPSMRLDVPAAPPQPNAKTKAMDVQAKERKSKLKAIDDFFEEAKSYAKNRPIGGKREAQPSAIPAWEAMLPFVRGEIPLFIHADEVREIKAAVEWASGKGYKVVIAGGRDAWMVADLLAAKKVPVIFEHVFTQPVRDTDAYDAQFKAAAVLHKAGVKFAFSEGFSDSAGAYNARNLPYSAAQAMAFGLPPEIALRAITLAPAEILGVAARLGSIEKGKEATLFASDGDILDIRSNVKHMWIAGQEMDLSSRHTRLYEKYKSRPKAGN